MQNPIWTLYKITANKIDLYFIKVYFFAAIFVLPLQLVLESRKMYLKLRLHY